VLGESRPHPRSYGSAARFLGEYIYGRKIDTPENAIHRMTSAPAVFFGLQDRGRIAVGAMADVVVFDPSRLRDTARFGDPHHYPDGIDWVIVNGRIVIDHGHHTGERPGRIL
jgi:N-acyl-D-aspartate/D-glutamate deacylase